MQDPDSTLKDLEKAEKLIDLNTQAGWAAPQLERGYGVGAGGARLEEKLSPPKEEEEEEQLDEEEQEQARYSRRQPVAALGRWGPKPSVKDQREQHPDSVRVRDSHTEVLALAPGSKDLERWNEIEKLIYDLEAPSYVLTQYERVFHEGAWHLFVTLARLEYQQL
jgi:hypothetical protein